MAQVRAITIQHERVLLVFGNRRGEAKNHRTEWCVAANACRCMRCGRSSNNMNIQGTCDGPKWR